MHIQIAGSLLDPSIEATASFHPTLRRYVNSSFQVGFGSEAGWMSHGPEHWTKFIDQTIAATNQPVVVSDVRIPHEAEWVTDERPFGHDGVLIGIERARRRDVRDPEHVSERHSSQLSPTVTLLNDGSKAELFAAADDFIERIVERCRGRGVPAELHR